MQALAAFIGDETFERTTCKSFVSGCTVTRKHGFITLKAKRLKRPKECESIHRLLNALIALWVDGILS